MLTVTGVTTDGRQIPLAPMVKMQLKKSLWIPAHSFHGEFLWETPQEELAYLTAALEDKTVFHGPVDEQVLTRTAQGVALSVSARSKAAYLLDNEAIPRIYDRPSFEDICCIHCKPYGFEKYRGAGRCRQNFR